MANWKTICILFAVLMTTVVAAEETASTPVDTEAAHNTQSEAAEVATEEEVASSGADASFDEDEEDENDEEDSTAEEAEDDEDVDDEDSTDLESTEVDSDSEVGDNDFWGRRRRRRRRRRGFHASKVNKKNLWQVLASIYDKCPTAKQVEEYCEKLGDLKECPDTAWYFAKLAVAYKNCKHLPEVQAVWNIARADPFNKCSYSCHFGKKLHRKNKGEGGFVRHDKFLRKFDLPAKGKLPNVEDTSNESENNDEDASEDSEDGADSDDADVESSDSTPSTVTSGLVMSEDALNRARDQGRGQLVKDVDMGGSGWWCCFGFC